MTWFVEGIAWLSLTGIAGVAIGATLIGAGMPLLLIVGALRPSTETSRVMASGGQDARRRRTAA